MKHYSHPCFENSNYFHCFESEVHLCYSVQYERKWFFRYQFNWFSWHRRRVSATWGLRAAEWRIQFLYGVRDGFCRLPSGNVPNLREASIWETATVSRPVRSSSVQVVCSCVHHRAYKSKGTGKRKFVHSRKKECGAEVRIAAQLRRGVIEVQTRNEVHNHALSEHVWKHLPENRRLTRDEEAKASCMCVHVRHPWWKVTRKHCVLQGRAVAAMVGRCDGNRKVYSLPKKGSGKKASWRANNRKTWWSHYTCWCNFIQSFSFDRYISTNQQYFEQSLSFVLIFNKNSTKIQ